MWTCAHVAAGIMSEDTLSKTYMMYAMYAMYISVCIRIMIYLSTDVYILSIPYTHMYVRHIIESGAMEQCR